MPPDRDAIARALAATLIALSIGACSLVRIGPPNFDLPGSNAPLAAGATDLALIDRRRWNFPEKSVWRCWSSRPSWW